MAETTPKVGPVGDRTPSKSAVGGRPSKRDAVVNGALKTFGSHGFSSATIDLIAAAAGVSTRTVYAHFCSKEDVFAEALRWSARTVSEDYASRARLALDAPAVEPALRVLGDAFSRLRHRHPRHFAMVAQVKAAAVTLEQRDVDTWHDIGPMRVRAITQSILLELADRGWLRIGDPAVATGHFMALVTAESAVQPFPPTALTNAAIAEGVRSGVCAYLTGYAARASD